MFYNDNRSNTPDHHKNSAIWIALNRSDKTEIHHLSIQSDQIVCNKVIDMTERVTSLACAPFNLDMKSNTHSAREDEITVDDTKVISTDEDNKADKIQDCQLTTENSDTDACNQHSTTIDSHISYDEPHITVQADKIVVSTIEADCKPSDNFLEITYSIDDNLPQSNINVETSPQLIPSTQTTSDTTNTFEGNLGLM